MRADKTRPGRTLLRRELEPLLLVSCTCNHRWYISRVAYATQTRRDHSKGSECDVGTLDGKVAIVTGASRGIGRAIRRSMARCGAIPPFRLGPSLRTSSRAFGFDL